LFPFRLNASSEQFEGETVFDGTVEIYTLSGHPKANEAFSWAFHGTEPQYLAVLKVPPINDPSDAVRAAIASGVFSSK
jgi:hypothetical protein